MAVTKEQWAQIEEQLSGMYGRVELRCDGYAVVAEIKTIAKFKQGIVVYVDGYIRGEWMKGENEEPRKFHREVKRHLFPAKVREQAKAKLKKRHMPESLRDLWKREMTATHSAWYPWWTNAKAFTRHLRKTCNDIGVVKIGYGGEA